MEKLVKESGLIKARIKVYSNHLRRLNEPLCGVQVLELDERLGRVSNILDEFEQVQGTIEMTATDIQVVQAHLVERANLAKPFIVRSL